MDPLVAQVQQRLYGFLRKGTWPVASHKQFAHVLSDVTELVRLAESGALARDRVLDLTACQTPRPVGRPIVGLPPQEPVVRPIVCFPPVDPGFHMAVNDPGADLISLADG